MSNWRELLLTHIPETTMFEFRINVAMDEQHDGRARHVFTTEWMDRADFDRAAEHVTDTMLV